MLHFKKTVAIFAIVLSACTVGSNPSYNAPVAQRTSAIVTSPEALTQFLRDTTAKSYTREHGTQISYFEADGRYNLVYPGNTAVLKGKWEVRDGGVLGLKICYSYTTPTHNPVTRERKGVDEWYCHNARGSLIRWQEIRDGDPLNIAATTILPQRMPKGLNLSLPTAAKAVGLSTHMSPNKSPNPDRAADARVGL